MVPRLELDSDAVVNLVTAAQLLAGETYIIQMAGNNYAEVLMEERTDPANPATGVTSWHLYPKTEVAYEVVEGRPAVVQVTTPYQTALLRISGPVG